MAAAHQTQLREERSHNRLARQAASEAGTRRGLRARMQSILLHSRWATALVICIPLLYTLNAAHVTAQRAPHHAATSAMSVQQAPSTTVVAPRISADIVRIPRNYPLPR
jgi:hypothetical protein